MNITAPSAHHIHINNDQQKIINAPIHPNLTQGPVPSWVTSLSLAQETPPDASQVNLQCLLFDKQIDIATKTTYIHSAYKILTKFGIDAVSNRYFDFDPNRENLVFHFITILRDKIPIQKLDMDQIRIIQREKDLENKCFSEKLTAVLFLEDVREGDILEYAYSRSDVQNLFKTNFSYSFDFSDPHKTERLRLRLVKTPNQSLQIRHRSAQIKSFFTENECEYAWYFEPSLICEDEETDQPEGYKRPDIEISSFATWKDFAQYVHNFYKINSTFGKDPTVIQLVQKWKNTSSSQAEQALKALRFVQDEVRYLCFCGGTKSYVPADPLQTFKCRFGDCKAKSQLFRAFLTLLDIPSSSCLVNSKLKGWIADRLPNPTCFDHVIVRIDLTDKPIFVDATRNYQGGDLFHTSIENYGVGLLLLEDSTGFIPIQSPFIDTNYEVFKTLKPQPNGQVELQVISRYFGEDADYKRSEIKGRRFKKISEERKSLIKKELGPIEALNAMQVQDDRVINKIEITDSYQLLDPWKENAQKKKEILCTPTSISRYLNQTVDIERKSPLALDDPNKLKETFIIFGPHLAPEALTIEHKAFTFSCEYSGNPESQGTIVYKLVKHLNALNPEDLKDFSKKLKEALHVAHFTMITPD